MPDDKPISFSCLFEERCSDRMGLAVKLWVTDGVAEGVGDDDSVLEGVTVEDGVADGLGEAVEV